MSDATAAAAAHRQLTDLLIGVLTVALATVVLVAIFMAYVVYNGNQVMKRVKELGDTTKMAAMVASGVKGLTEGLGAAIGAITCQAPPLPPIPPLDRKKQLQAA
jgi:hypothetical protein